MVVLEDDVVRATEARVELCLAVVLGLLQGLARKCETSARTNGDMRVGTRERRTRTRSRTRHGRNYAEEGGGMDEEDG